MTHSSGNWESVDIGELRARSDPRLARVLWAALVSGIACVVPLLDAKLTTMNRLIAIAAIFSTAAVVIFSIVNFSRFVEFGDLGARVRTRAGRDERELFDPSFAYTLSFRNSGRTLFWRFSFGNAPDLRYKLTARFSETSDTHEAYLLSILERLVWPAAFEHLERGEPVNFGLLSLSNTGVVIANRTWEWAAISRVELSFNWISGRSQLEMWTNGGARFLRANVAKVWNWPLFIGIGKTYVPAIGELKRER